MATSLGKPAAQVLLDYAGKEDRYEKSAAELLPLQLEAINDRFKDRVGKIKLLQNRAETGGVTEIRSVHDVIPLLFAHTAYKSYPESWLFEKRWDRLGKWLSTVSTYDVAPPEGEITGFDNWLMRLEENGHYVACSSGTTGKCAMMDSTLGDIDFGGQDLFAAIKFTGLNPDNDRRLIGLGQVASTAKNRLTGRAMAESMSMRDLPPAMPDVPPITIGGIVEMVVLRKKMADGSAKPSEVEYFEAVSAQRAKDMQSSVEQAANLLIDNRHLPLHVLGMLAPLYNVAELVRSRGYSAKDFQPNTTFLSGGLKRAAVPEDYRRYIFETFNLSEDRTCQTFGMQEMNSQFPRCSHDRYHTPPWVLLLLLDESGETLIEPSEAGEHVGRGAFFDISLDARWGGVISGDKLSVSWAPCGCGNRSPSFSADIQRYADTEGGDKIACSGTIDAYVRGAA